MEYLNEKQFDHPTDFVQKPKGKGKRDREHEIDEGKNDFGYAQSIDEA